ncbi:MAG: acyl-CoA dehydrogenase family protein [Syntrophales bacterium]|jgi:acyl-CoA dehydrogenase|nr:acyl-CoA dehydrogenase family protein [Syntrophales bacterium]MDD4464880.1 acyl-CoA dehydrogenase family protein [Desulfobacterales bacterium]HPJ97258.1 acyl-CoA dehydrogenase family protein [Syntrophales bacterium]
MEIIQYKEEHKIFRESLRKFIDREVIPYVEEWEETGIVPKSAWKKMGEQGFLGISVPEEYGGLGADFLYSVVLMEEMIRTNQSGLFAQLHNDVVVPYIVSYGSEEQKKKYLPGCVSGDIITAVAMTEPNAGSDLAAMKTTVVKDGDHLIINGQKTFISNGINCDLVVLAAKDPSVENPHMAVDLYLVEAGTPGFEKGKRMKKIGWHSQDTAELYFNDCRVPKENLLGKKGTGFIKLMEKLQQERLIACIGSVAGAAYMLDTTIKYCKERIVFGKPLTKFQNTQFEIVEMATEVKLGRTFVDKLIVDHMEGKNIVIETSMAKCWTTDMAFRVADRCLQLHGGYGYCEEYPIARAWRDIRVARIFAGSNEIMKTIAARFMGL